MIVKDAIYEGAAILAIVDTITIGVEGLTILVELGAAGGAKVLWTRIGDPDICAIGVFFATDRGRLLVTHGNAITTEAHLGRTGVELVGNEIAVGVGVDKLVEGILVGVGGVGGQDLRDEVVVLGVVLGAAVGSLGVVHLVGGLSNAREVRVTRYSAGVAVITDILHGIGSLHLTDKQNPSATLVYLKTEVVPTNHTTIHQSYHCYLSIYLSTNHFPYFSFQFVWF